MRITLITFFLLFLPFTAFLQKTGMLVLSGDADYYGFDKTAFVVYCDEIPIGTFDKNGHFIVSADQKTPLTIKHPEFLPYMVKELSFSKRNSREYVSEKIKPEIEKTIFEQFKAEQSSTCTGSNKNDIDVLSIDTLAEFHGGNNALFKFISEHTVYPQAAVERGITGKVYVQFIIEADGSISCIKVVKGADYLLDREAFRCVKSLPKFIPARHNGVAVPILFSLPISFNLN